jgi:hypothetical protein
MSLDIKRAINLPFGGQQSLIAIVIGSLLSLPAAWMSTHKDSPESLGVLVFAATLLLTGYGVRIMRQQLSSTPVNGLPSWTDNPLQLVLDALATWIGTFVAALFFLAIVGILTFVGLTLVIGADSSGPGTYGLYASMGAAGVFISILFGMVPLSLYMSMLTPHYATEDRFAAVFEWRKIWRSVFSRFGAMLLTLVLCFVAIGVAQSIGEALFVAVGAGGAKFIPDAILGFIGSATVSNLVAQQYAIARSKLDSAK